MSLISPAVRRPIQSTARDRIGEIDGVGEVKKKDGTVVGVRAPKALARYIAAKVDEFSPSERKNYQHVIKPLLRLYASAVAADFSPKNLKTVIQAMIDLGRVRTRINRDVRRLRG